jgi:predicted ester cyclase
MKETVSAFRAAFSDFAVDVEDVLAEGDKVGLTYRASGTNGGEMMGTPATGESAGWRVMHIFTLRDSKIVDDVTILDRMALMEQLGQAQSPAEA